MEEDDWLRVASTTPVLLAVPAGKLSQMAAGAAQEASSSEKILAATQIEDIHTC